MKFLYPAFLFALFTIAIPIIIHLFSFRRYKTVYFSHVGFLKNIKKESQKKSKLKQLLMLLARILTIIFLVIAFSQPYIPAENAATTGSGNIVGVYIDNSFSMNALSEKGQLLERARSKAAEIGQNYPSGTRFMLLTNDLEPGHQHPLNQEQFIREVAEVSVSPAVVPLSQIQNRFDIQNKQAENSAQEILYLISDFQRNVVDLENFSGESVFNYFLPLVPNQVNNLYIDSCWVEVPAHGLNQEETIFVKIKNSSDEDYQNLPLRLFLNDSLKSITNFSVAARNEITAGLKFTNGISGIQLGRVEITDYPFIHDNTWFLSYFVEPKLNALAIYNSTQSSQEGLSYLTALFENDDYVELETMDIQSLQISKLAASNTIFLINPESFSSGFLNELETAAENGCSVVLFPDFAPEIATTNQFLTKFNASVISGIDTTSQEISGIDFDNRFFQNVFRERKENALLPKIKGHFRFTENIRSDETQLLWFQNGDKALSGMPFGKGKVWVFSFPLNKTNEIFARDILFVPSIYNIVLNSLPDQKISYTIGTDKSWLLPQNVNISLETTPEIENRDSGTRFIPGMNISGQGIRLDMGQSVETAGHYLVKNGNETLASVSYNYNRDESDLRYFTETELEDRLEDANLENGVVLADVSDDFSQVLQEIQKGSQLWKWCLLLALLFIFAEVLIARFLKR